VDVVDAPDVGVGRLDGGVGAGGVGRHGAGVGYERSF